MEITNFKKDNYVVCRQVISKELAEFCYNYFLLKKTVAKTLFKHKRIPKEETIHGELGDTQVPTAFAIYADVLAEVLLMLLLDKTKEVTELNLVPNYSFARFYTKGDYLYRHKDRFSCEISTTLNLGGDPWPIYLDPDTKNGYLDANNQVYVQGNKPGIEINLEPGDMLIYKGADNEHWREVFKGETCAQVFLHYNTADNEKAKNNIYDGKPHLGLPFDFKDIGSQF